MYTTSSSANSSPKPAPLLHRASASSADSRSVSDGRRNSKASVEFVRHLCKAFEEAYGHPSPLSAAVRRCEHPGLVSIEYTTSQRDFARDTRRKVVSHMLFCIQNGRLSKLSTSTPADATNVCSSLQSPTDSSLLAVLRSVSSTERVVEIWRNDALLKCIDVTNEHGDFYGDSTFGSLAWSNNNSCIVYTAERPEYAKAKAESSDTADAAASDAEKIFDGNVTDDIDGGVGGVADSRRYEMDSDWGETFNGKRPPVLVMLDVQTASVTILPSPDGVSPGQAQFLPDSTAANGVPRIVFTGYKHTIRKYGIVYCQNRPSGLYACDLGAKEFECIYSGAVRSPRVTPSGSGVVFLSTMLGGPHASTSELVFYDLERRDSRVVVPIIFRPLDGQQRINDTLLPDGFVGIYADQLPMNPWLRIDSHSKRDILVFTSAWRSTNAILTYDIQNQALERQTPVDNTSSNSVLSANGDLVAGIISTPGEPGSLMIGEAIDDASPSVGKVKIKWHKQQILSSGSLSWKVIQSSESKSSVLLPESIFVYPANSGAETRYFWKDGKPKSRPLIVQPHGGPHAAFTLDYNPCTAGLAKLGFGVLLVNFTGSLGFGQDSVFAQIGNMDTLTIDEIQHSAAQIHKNSEGDADATVYLGGSYSGYTGAMLAGLVPGFYRAIALRNPVISIGENAAMSDIPDWCWAELGLEYNFEMPPELTPDVFAQMWKASPSRIAHKVQDPVLLLLGANDRRVPPPQSLSYYYRLKAAKAPVQCKIYPSVGHPLNSIEAERDSFVSIARFYASSLKKDSKSGKTDCIKP
ncbi:hypothetical protein GGI25_004615 [Coemansia spiralis]|uniref:acylaminoacyl-peptidase n=2 Tax=Coemansia TaxID=4863 RepID=A0A9W8KWH1_9FUNG|nr:hypothetical protein EDC05_004540 [Coemansia umbellata]KAJ2620439.1 hypothetical protein GGI26_005009 [Coemansia sp. RSA 1358]KAJ2673630.1 hypothetical protein GGI25_004615 [Coemansia spiralis]